MEFFFSEKHARLNVKILTQSNLRVKNDVFDPRGREKKKRQPRMKKETAVPLKKQCQECQKYEEMGEL